MRRHLASPRVAWGIAAMVLAVRSTVAAQGSGPPAVRAESMTVVASTHYQAGALRRWVVGSAYRDLWAMPIRVPVLDLDTYAGGLRPTKEGGGLQTKSLRLEAAGGLQYVFRLSDKGPAMSEGIRPAQ
jgi:hypothetical protein